MQRYEHLFLIVPLNGQKIVEALTEAEHDGYELVACSPSVKGTSLEAGFVSSFGLFFKRPVDVSSQERDPPQHLDWN